MKIPNQIIVGAHAIKIIFKEMPNDEHGEFDTHTNTITLDINDTKSMQESTLFHEILHVINMEMDEERVEFLAQAFYAVLKNNDMLK